MSQFKLDPKLNNDCIVLGKLQVSQLLLMNNSLVPWFILVPEVEVIEVYQLDTDIQQRLLAEINQLSQFVMTTYSAEKLNVAAIGNVVKQLHIHIVGRNKHDFCWPNAVWGTEQKEPYSGQEVNNTIELLKNSFEPFNPTYKPGSTISF